MYMNRDDLAVRLRLCAERAWHNSSSYKVSCSRLACTSASSVCAPICFLVKTTRFLNLSPASALTSSALVCGASEM